MKKQRIFAGLWAAVLLCAVLLTAGCGSGEILASQAAQDTWGICLAAEDPTSVGATIRCVQNGGSPDGELTYGSPFFLERLEGDQWEEVKTVEPTAWTMIGYTLEMGSSHKWEVSWESIYGELLPGNYRFCKEFLAYRGPGDYDKRVYYAEFEVPEE